MFWDSFNVFTNVLEFLAHVLEFFGIMLVLCGMWWWPGSPRGLGMGWPVGIGGYRLADDDCASVASSHSTAILLLPLNPDGIADILCGLCGVGCKAPGGFHDSSSSDIYGGMTPWPRYRKSKCGNFRIPRDKLCMICSMVFLHSPLKLKHKTITNFKAFLQKTPLEALEFRKLTKKQRELIETDPRGSVAALKSLDATHTMQLVQEDGPYPPPWNL